jgi:hypothetical protein
MPRSLDDILKFRLKRFDVLRWFDRPVGPAEHTSILSLITYAALETDTPVEELQNLFMAHFDLSRIEDLRGEDYDDAIHFLMQWHEARMAAEEEQAKSA